MIRSIHVFLGILVLCMPLSAGAALLDWDTSTWPETNPATLTQTYNIESQDLSVEISGDQDWYRYGRWDQYSAEPHTGTQSGGISFEGGLGGEDTLLLFMEYDDLANDELTITFDFSDYDYGVENIAFSIIDIDNSNDLGSWAWTDDITLTASLDGVAIDTSDISITGNPSYHSVTDNRILGTDTADNDSSQGTAAFSINTRIDQFTLSYRNDYAGSITGMTTGQAIGIHDIAFDVADVTSVPEPSVMALMAIGALVVFTFEIKRLGRLKV